MWSRRCSITGHWPTELGIQGASQAHNYIDSTIDSIWIHTQTWISYAIAQDPANKVCQFHGASGMATCFPAPRRLPCLPYCDPATPPSAAQGAHAAGVGRSFAARRRSTGAACRPAVSAPREGLGRWSAVPGVQRAKIQVPKDKDEATKPLGIYVCFYLN